MPKIKLVKNIPLREERPSKYPFDKMAVGESHKIKIDKNIPLRQPLRQGRPSKYPFAEMAVGDSFFVDESQRRSVASAAYAYGSGQGKKFVCRTQVGGGLRVWRTK